MNSSVPMFRPQFTEEDQAPGMALGSRPAPAQLSWVTPGISLGPDCLIHQRRQQEMTHVRRPGCGEGRRTWHICLLRLTVLDREYRALGVPAPTVHLITHSSSEHGRVLLSQKRQ